MIVYIVRHGETVMNKERRVVGITNPPLSARGIEQAEASAHWLKAHGRSLVVSSDLLRARQTAEIIAAEIDISYDISTDLRERDFRHLEGMPIEDLRAKMRQSGLSPDLATIDWSGFPDVEDEACVITRFVSVCRRYSGKTKTLVIVTHAGIAHAAFNWCCARDDRYSDYAMHIPKIRPGNIGEMEFAPAPRECGRWIRVIDPEGGTK